MAITLKLSDELIDLAKPRAAAEHRSVSKQIEYWARLGKVAEDNPELPLQFIKDTLLGVAEANAGQLSGYKQEKKTIAGKAKVAADRAADSIDDVLSFVDASNKRIAAMEAKALANARKVF
jgi:hypothetical protein